MPILKKGDLNKCDNWRGIALLDVVGKAIARILQDRLQVLAEEVLPESVFQYNHVQYTHMNIHL